MQVLSQGPSLLLAVWTGLALLEGGESYCRYSCATTESHNVRQGDSSVFSCEGTYISWCYTSRTPTRSITTNSNNQRIRNSWLVYDNIRSGLTLQCDSSSSCIKRISVNVIVPLSSVTLSIRGSSRIRYRAALSLTCSISGTRGTYNWYRNYSFIRSTTSSSYYKSSAQLSDSGSYYCRACNWAGCRSSSSRTVTVTGPPYSVSISGSSRIRYTSSLRLTCYASGVVESYYWYRNASNIRTISSNATADSYVKYPVQLSDSGSYYCTACNWAYCTSSSTQTIKVTARPYSVSISGSSSIGSTPTLSLTCYASGMVERYEWYRNASNIRTTYSTATANSYVKYSAQLSDSGVYYCRACNWAYCTSSSTQTIKARAPSSATISGSSTVGYTQRLRLTCSVSGIASSYQWYRNYIRLSSTSRYYSKSAQPSDSGSYQCRACNWAGCTGYSSSRTVTVTAVPPSSVRIGGRSQIRYTSTLSLTCYASGIVDSTTWYRNSTKLINGTSRSYVKSPAQLSDSGSYQCVACNWAGCSTTSSSYTIRVTEPPYSVSISGKSKFLSTTSLSLTCSASGAVETYEWYRNGSQLSTTTSYYRKSPAQLSDRGSYQCRACNWVACMSSSSYTVNVIDVPDAVEVSSIEVINTTFDTISIQWTPPNNNFDSIIDYRVDLYGSGGHVGVFTSSQPMVTLVSLQPFTTYQITISARNNAGRGGNSGLRTVNTLTRDDVLASNVTYSTPRVGVSAYTVELRWVVPKGLLTDKLVGYRLSRWLTNTTNIETTTVNRDNVSCAWNVTAIGSETYCHEWEGFSPGSQYTVSLEIIYNYGILSTGGPTNVNITIPILPLREVGTVSLAVGVAVGVFLAILVAVAVIVVVLLICKMCRRRKAKDTDTVAVYNVNKDVNDNPLETVQFEPAYGGDDYTLTDDPRYVTEDLKMSRDPHCISEDRVTSQEQHYASLDLKSVQTSAYASLTFNRNSSTAIGKYGDNPTNTSEYETPQNVVPQKKPSTQQTHEYANWNVISQKHGEGDQSSVDRKSSNKIPSTSGPGVKEVGKETTAPRKSQVFALDVSMATKKEDIGDTHEQREKIPPPTKKRPDTNKKQSILPPTQESATPKPQALPQQPNPVMTGSLLDASPKPPITSKAKKQPLLPKKFPGNNQ